MPKQELLDKPTSARVTRSLRKRLGSVDSDNSVRSNTPTKNINDAENVLQIDEKTRASSPGTPGKHNTELIPPKRRNSQSETNTPLRTPGRRSTRRISLSEVESSSTASPLRRNARKAASNLLEEGTSVTSGRNRRRSPITVSVVPEEDEVLYEDKENKLEIKRVTRSASKSPNLLSSDIGKIKRTSKRNTNADKMLLDKKSTSSEEHPDVSLGISPQKDNQHEINQENTNLDDSGDVELVVEEEEEEEHEDTENLLPEKEVSLYQKEFDADIKHNGEVFLGKEKKALDNIMETSIVTLDSDQNIEINPKENTNDQKLGSKLEERTKDIEMEIDIREKDKDGEIKSGEKKDKEETGSKEENTDETVDNNSKAEDGNRVVGDDLKGGNKDEEIKGNAEEGSDDGENEGVLKGGPQAGDRNKEVENVSKEESKDEGKMESSAKEKSNDGENEDVLKEWAHAEDRYKEVENDSKKGSKGNEMKSKLEEKTKDGEVEDVLKVAQVAEDKNKLADNASKEESKDEEMKSSHEEEKTNDGEIEDGLKEGTEVEDRNKEAENDSKKENKDVEIKSNVKRKVNDGETKDVLKEGTQTQDKNKEVENDSKEESKDEEMKSNVKEKTNDNVLNEGSPDGEVENNLKEKKKDWEAEMRLKERNKHGEVENEIKEQKNDGKSGIGLKKQTENKDSIESIPIIENNKSEEINVENSQKISDIVNEDNAKETIQTTFGQEKMEEKSGQMIGIETSQASTGLNSLALESNISEGNKEKNIEKYQNMDLDTMHEKVDENISGLGKSLMEIVPNLERKDDKNSLGERDTQNTQIDLKLQTASNNKSENETKEYVDKESDKKVENKSVTVNEGNCPDSEMDVENTICSEQGVIENSEVGIIFLGKKEEIEMRKNAKNGEENYDQVIKGESKEDLKLIGSFGGDNEYTSQNLTSPNISNGANVEELKNQSIETDIQSEKKVSESEDSVKDKTIETINLYDSDDCEHDANSNETLQLLEKSQGSKSIKQRSVVFDDTTCDDKTSSKFPKTPVLSKNKIRTKDKWTGAMSASEDYYDKLVNEKPEFERALLSTETTDQDTPCKLKKRISVSSSTPILSLKQENTESNDVKDKNNLLCTENKSPSSAIKILKRSAESDFPKSWSQAVKGKSDDKDSGQHFIDGFGLNTGKESIKGMKESQKVSEDLERYSTSEEDEDDECNLKNAFIDDEAEEADEEDSIGSEEREYLESNEIPIQGESIGSEDTEEDEEIGEEEEYDSFIVSNDEEEDVELVSVDTDDLSEISVETIKKTFKRLSRKILESSSEDDDHESQMDRNPNKKERVGKRDGKRSVRIPSSESEADTEEFQKMDNKSEESGEIEVEEQDKKLSTEKTIRKIVLDQGSTEIIEISTSNDKNIDKVQEEIKSEKLQSKDNENTVEFDAFQISDGNSSQQTNSVQLIESEKVSETDEAISTTSDMVTRCGKEKQNTFVIIHDIKVLKNKEKEIEQAKDALQNNDSKHKGEKSNTENKVSDSNIEDENLDQEKENDDKECLRSVKLQEKKIGSKDEESEKDLKTIEARRKSVDISICENELNAQELHSENRKTSETEADTSEENEIQNKYQEEDSIENIVMKEKTGKNKKRLFVGTEITSEVRKKERSKKQDVQSVSLNSFDDNKGTNFAKIKHFSFTGPLSTKYSTEDSQGKQTLKKYLSGNKESSSRAKTTRQSRGNKTTAFEISELYLNQLFGETSTDNIKNYKHCKKASSEISKEGDWIVSPVEPSLETSPSYEKLSRSTKKHHKLISSLSLDDDEFTDYKEGAVKKVKKRPFQYIQEYDSIKNDAEDLDVTNKKKKKKMFPRKKVRNETDRYDEDSPIKTELAPRLKEEVESITKAVQTGAKLLQKQIKKYKALGKKAEENKTLNTDYKRTKFRVVNEVEKSIRGDNVQGIRSSRKREMSSKYQNLDTSGNEICFLKTSSGFFVEELLPPKEKKPKIISKFELASGTVYEEAVTPTPKNQNYFKETEVTPKSLGFKIKNILSAGQEEIPVLKKKSKNKSKLVLKEPTSTLLKPRFTQSGEFKEELLKNKLTEYKPLNMNESVSTDFFVVPLESSKTKSQKHNPTEVSASALQFKQNALYSPSIKRETSKQILQRKEKKRIYHKL